MSVRMYIVEFQNRLLVLFQRARNYVTWNRSARLIPGKDPLPFRVEKQPGRDEIR
jgi:hypothetical protein